MREESRLKLNGDWFALAGGDPRMLLAGPGSALRNEEENDAEAERGPPRPCLVNCGSQLTGSTLRLRLASGPVAPAKRGELELRRG